MKRKFTFKLLFLAGLVIYSHLPFVIPMHRNAIIRNEYLLADIDKHEILANTPSPKIVFVGGSNLAFGISSGQIKKATGYNVVNMGIYIGLGLSYMLEEVKPYMNSGDIVVIVPEYEVYFPELIEDKDYLLRLLLYYPKGVKYLRDPLTILEVSNNFFYGYSQVLRTSVNQAISPQENYEDIYLRSAFNKFGDVTSHLETSSYPPRKEKLNRKVWQIDWTAVKLMNQFNADVQKRGVKVYYLYPSVSELYVKISLDTIKAIDGRLRQKLNFPILSTPERYIYPIEDFFDTVYHLNAQGREKRSQMVIKDLKSVLP